MKQFKEMKAVFKGIGRDRCEGKTYPTITIERHLSGAFAYGDRSAHSLSFNEESMPNYYDTRYDGISSDKDKWLAFWKDYIETNFLVKDLELVSYESWFKEVKE